MLRIGIAFVTALGMASQAYAPPLNMRSGPNSNVDGYLRVGADEYGSFVSPSFDAATFGDHYNPLGGSGLGLAETTFTNGFMIFSFSNQVRGLLSDSAVWQGTCGGATTTLTIINPNVGFDTNADGFNDFLSSTFRVQGGASFDLEVDVEQEVDSVPGNSIALLTQRYTITNNAGAPGRRR